MNLEYCESNLLYPTEYPNKKFEYEKNWNNAIPFSSIFWRFYLQFCGDGELNSGIRESTRLLSK